MSVLVRYVEQYDNDFTLYLSSVRIIESQDSI